MNITIDPEFRDLIPPICDDDRCALETSIMQEGCREPLVVWPTDAGLILIDGHNRKAICDELGLEYSTTERQFTDRDDAMLWIIQNQLARRNISVGQRASLAMRHSEIVAAKARERQLATLKRGDEAPVPLNSGERGEKPRRDLETNRQLATMFGVGHDTIAKVRYVHTHGTEDDKAKLNKPDVSVNKVHSAVKERVQHERRQAERLTAAKSVETMNKRIVVGDFVQHADKVPNNSVSLIFTDPPYDREASKMLDGLGRFAAEKLAPGGSLIAYVGTTQIPAALDAFRTHLRYWWTICCLHSGGANLMREYGIRATWKAMLWFVKDTRDNKSHIVHDVVSGGREKQAHDWQQAQVEAEYWIEQLTPKDGLVVDPFLGGGTTAAAAKKLGRPWIGFEIDPDTAKIASGRIG